VADGDHYRLCRFHRIRHQGYIVFVHIVESGVSPIEHFNLDVCTTPQTSHAAGDISETGFVFNGGTQ